MAARGNGCRCFALWQKVWIGGKGDEQQVMPFPPFRRSRAVSCIQRANVFAPIYRLPMFARELSCVLQVTIYTLQNSHSLVEIAMLGGEISTFGSLLVQLQSWDANVQTGVATHGTPAV